MSIRLLSLSVVINRHQVRASLRCGFCECVTRKPIKRNTHLNNENFLSFFVAEGDEGGVEAGEDEDDELFSFLLNIFFSCVRARLVGACQRQRSVACRL